jgi:hypothetical protein
LQLRYKAQTKYGPLYGFGETRTISSKDIIFAGGNELQPGMKAEIAVAWPLLLDGHIRLQLMLKTIITSCQDGVVEARILEYDFRTHGLGVAPLRDHKAGQ